MADFESPQSRNEAILQNVLGADNELGDPLSRIEALLMQLLDTVKTIEGWQEAAALAGKTLLEVVEEGDSNA